MIPTSAHGTNPASAAMAGMDIYKVNVLKNGEIDMNMLVDLAKKYMFPEQLIQNFLNENV